MTQLMKVPIVLWNDEPPSHQITCLTVCKNGMIVTGSIEGQIVTWTVHKKENEYKINPQSMIIAHASSVESVVGVYNDHLEINSGIISLAANQEVCLWNTETSCCLSNTYLKGRYHSLYAMPCRFTNTIKECLVACFGYQEFILIIDSFSLVPIFILKQNLLRCSLCTIRDVVVTSFHSKDHENLFLALTHDSSVVSWNIPNNIEFAANSEPKILNPKYVNVEQHIINSGIRYVSIEQTNYHFCALANLNSVFILKLFDYSLVSTIPISHGSVNHLHFVSDRILFVFMEQNCPIALILDPIRFELIKTIHLTATNADHESFFGTVLNVSSLNKIFIFNASVSGKIIFWNMNPAEVNETETIPFSAETSIKKTWNEIEPSGISSILAKSLSYEQGCVSCTLQLQEYGFMIFGLKDGSIVISNTLELLISRMLDTIEPQNISSVILKGHEGSVYCLCHPFEECTAHNPAHLLSGGADFSVRLWNMVTGEQLKVYYPHGGFVQDIFVINTNATASSNLNVVSVASDYSVSLINLFYEKEILTTRCHSSPIYAVKCRLQEDLLLVLCSDGILFIWHISTGNLERCVTGRIALDIFENNEFEDVEEEDQASLEENIVVNMYSVQKSTRSFDILRDMKTKRGFMGSYHHTAHDMSSRKKVFHKVFHRLAVSKRLHQNKFNLKELDPALLPLHPATSVPNLSTNYSSACNLVVQSSTNTNTHTDNHVSYTFSSTIVPPFDVISVRTSHHDADFHIFLIDIDVLVSQLLDEEEYQYLKENISKMNLISSVSLSKESINAATTACTYHNMPNHVMSHNNLAMLILTLGLTPTTDSNTYLKYLKSIQKYHSNLLLNIARLMISILHPWGLSALHDSICRDHLELSPPSHTITFGYMSHNKILLNMPGWTPSDILFIPPPKANHVPLCHTYNLHWQISSVMTSQHTIVLVILVNTFLKLNSFDSNLESSDFQSRRSRVFDSQSQILSIKKSLKGRQFITASVPDLAQKSHLIVIDNKLSYWKLLFKFYTHVTEHMTNNHFYQQPLFHELILYWLDYYDEVKIAAYNLLRAELSRISSSTRAKLVSSWSVYLPKQSEVDQNDIEELLILSMDDYVDSGGFYGFWPSNKKYQRTIAVFLISFIASEFTDEFDPLIRKDGVSISPLSVGQTVCLASIMTRILKMKINLRSFTHYHVKKCELSLLGHSFKLWQPYLNTSEIISCILDNIATLRFHLQHLDVSNQKKSNRYIICQHMAAAHRDCLMDILFSNPEVLLHMLNKEMAKYSGTTHIHTFGASHSVFVNTSTITDVGRVHNPLIGVPNVFNLVRCELTYLIDRFATREPEKFKKLILESIDLLINCYCHKLYKEQSDIFVSFPFLRKFNILDYCCDTHRLVVGTQRGDLAVYDILSIHCHLHSLFKTPIDCVKFGPDSKHCVVVNMTENKIIILNSQTNMLGMTTHSFRTEHTFILADMPSIPPHLLHKIKIEWISSNKFKLVLPNQNEFNLSF